jgi:hypothetical protein
MFDYGYRKVEDGDKYIYPTIVAVVSLTKQASSLLITTQKNSAKSMDSRLTEFIWQAQVQRSSGAA